MNATNAGTDNAMNVMNVFKFFARINVGKIIGCPNKWVCLYTDSDFFGTPYIFSFPNYLNKCGILVEE